MHPQIRNSFGYWTALANGFPSRYSIRSQNLCDYGAFMLNKWSYLWPQRSCKNVNFAWQKPYIGYPSDISSFSH